MVSVPWQGLQEHPKHQISVLGVVLIYLGLLMEQNVPLHSPILPSITQWAPDTHKASTPHLSGFGLMPRKHLTHVEESVDALIDSLMEFKETFQLSFNSSQSDSIVGLLKHKNSSERIHDQIHNKTTLTDSDCMTYLFQNQDNEAKKAVESLGVTGHSYPTVVKTLKCQF